MKIAVYASALFKDGYDDEQNHIVETLLSLTRQQPAHRFFIVTDSKQPVQHTLLPNTEIVVVKPAIRNGLLKKIWWEVNLPGCLKKIPADFLISFDGDCSLAAALPQCIIAGDSGKIRNSCFKKAKLVVVKNEAGQKLLECKYKRASEKTVLIYPSASNAYQPATEDGKEIIKNRYSEGKEFFLYNASLAGTEKFIELLKAFSHFKKRLQSGMQLLLLSASSSYFEKSLSAYKYRDDVKFIGVKTKEEAVSITNSAYAIVLPFNGNEDMVAALNAMNAAIPVIATQNSGVSEVAGDAAAYAEAGNVKEIGEKMIQLYTNEKYRAGLIEKGKTVAASFTPGRAAGLLWQSILTSVT